MHQDYLNPNSFKFIDASYIFVWNKKNMDQFGEVIKHILDDQKHVKDLQMQLYDSLKILMDNQKLQSENETVVINNQSTIIKNQQIIIENQLNIIGNQKHILGNQGQLSVLLEIQSEILNKIRNMEGKNESPELTKAYINGLIQKSSKS